MSLAWTIETLNTPFGDVKTLHWAVQCEGDEETTPRSILRLQEEANNDASLLDAEDELGAVMWNSNGAVCRFLVDSGLLSLPQSTSNDAEEGRRKEARPRVLELGSGIGVLGIALAKSKACDSVAITDIPRLVPLMKRNVVINSLVQGTDAPVSAYSLKWGDGPLDCGLTKWWTTTVASSRKGDANTHPNLILMCDALYGNAKDWPKLVSLLHVLLDSNPNALIVNFCEQRVAGVEDGFLELLGKEENHINSNTSAALWPENIPEVFTSASSATTRVVEEEGKCWGWRRIELEEKSGLDLTIRCTIIRRRRPQAQAQEEEEQQQQKAQPLPSVAKPKKTQNKQRKPAVKRPRDE